MNNNATSKSRRLLPPRPEVRVLAIGDPHFKSGNEAQTSAFTRDLCAQIASGELKADAVVVLGDILHRHDKIDLNPLRRACAFLADLRSAMPPHAPLWILIGNHDLPNNAAFLTDEHAFNAMKMWTNTIVADRPTVAKVHGGSVNFLLMPYVPIGRFEEAIYTLDNFSVKLEDGPWWRVGPAAGVAGVFAHQEFRGVRMGCVVSASGDIYPRPETGAPVCVSGHIHEADDRIGVPNVIYVGTPFDHSWASVSEVSSQNSTMYAVSTLTYSCRGHDDNLYRLSKHERSSAPSARVPRNILVSFASLAELESVVTGHIGGGSGADNLIRAVIPDLSPDVSSVAKIKIKVKCTSSDDVRTIVTHGTSCVRAIRDLGITVVPVQTATTTSSDSSIQSTTTAAAAALRINKASVPFIERLMAAAGDGLLSDSAAQLIYEITAAP